MTALRRVTLALGIVGLLSTSSHAERIVAIGDVHGDHQALVSILTETGLIDDDLFWVGGNATLVQLGDFLDRGPDTRSVMDLLMRLQQEAPSSNGRVVVLMGNHEAMSILGELGDASAASLAAWDSEGSEKDRDVEYRNALRAARKRAALVGLQPPATGAAAKQLWMRKHPAGMVAYRRDLQPEGTYGRWLRTLPIVEKIGNNLFLHGGLDEVEAQHSIDDLVDRAHSEIERADNCRNALLDEGYLSLTSSGVDLIQAGLAMLERLRSKDSLEPERQATLTTLELCEDYDHWYLLSPTGPLWFRGYSRPREEFGWTEVEGANKIGQVLSAQAVDHIVVAHTPHEERRIVERFRGSVFLIDTGMLTAVYNGRPSALEIDGGVYTALYLGERRVLWKDPEVWTWKGRDAEPLPFSSEDELTEFLASAEVTSSRRISVGINDTYQLVLEKDGKTARGAFRNVDKVWRNEHGPDLVWHRLYRDSYLFECAAYELSRILGLNRVPPTVLRRWHGNRGSIQAWIENAQMQAEILKAKIQPPDLLSWAKQIAIRSLFDTLISNQDRNGGNTMVDADWRLWFIDHTRAFLVDPDPQRIAKLQRGNRELLDSMRRVDRAEVQNVLEPYLSKIEIRALFQRWDDILLHFDELVAERGPDLVFFP